MTNDQQQCCGECRWFKPPLEPQVIIFGTCHCPMPEAAESPHTEPIRADEGEACPCFVRKEEAELSHNIKRHIVEHEGRRYERIMWHGADGYRYATFIPLDERKEEPDQ